MLPEKQSLACYQALLEINTLPCILNALCEMCFVLSFESKNSAGPTAVYCEMEMDIQDLISVGSEGTNKLHVQVSEFPNHPPQLHRVLPFATTCSQKRVLYNQLKEQKGPKLGLQICQLDIWMQAKWMAAALQSHE